MTELPDRGILLVSLSILFVLGASLFSYCASASELSTPNTFEAGTPAVANEVNANFSAAETAVNDNDSRIAALEARLTALEAGQSTRVLANGISIGSWVGELSSMGALGGFRVLSDMDYLFDVIDFVDDQLNPHRPAEAGDLLNYFVLFDAPGCGGQAFLSAGRDLRTVTGLMAAQGYVFRSDDPADPIEQYYVVAGTEAVDLFMASIRSFSGGGCAPHGATSSVVPVLPNDPNITGVPNSRFAAPIRLGF